MFLSTQFQRIIYGAISCQFYFPLLGHHSKLKLSQKYQGIHHILFFIALYQLFCRSLATIHCTSISMVSAKLETTAEYCWELEVSIHNNTPLTAAATWLQLCTLWQLCCRECCTAYHLTSVTNGWEHCALLSLTLHLHIPCHMMATATTTPPQPPQRLSQSGCEDTKDCYLETQSSDDSSHWSNTVTMSWPCWCPVTLVSTWIPNSHTNNFEKLRSHKIKTNIDLFNDTCQYLASMVHGSNLTMQFLDSHILLRNTLLINFILQCFKFWKMTKTF